MHWDPLHVDPLLALRTVVCADRWDKAWPQITARLRTADRTRRLQRHHAAVARRAATAPADAPDTTPQALAAPAPSPLPQATPKTIVNGRPTKPHPWNRRFIPHRPSPGAEN
jgi:hypothetical protein